ncbi:MAG: hypothetical protein JXM68_05230 [Sedimentisphaerales bacterium]|nr:hypothetical protein [Sedimentisphaerales bacterium]
MKKKLVGIMVVVLSLTISTMTQAGSVAMELAAKAPSDSIAVFSSSGYANLEDELGSTLIADIIKDPQVHAFFGSLKELAKSRGIEIPSEPLAKFKWFQQSVKDAGLHLDARIYGLILNNIDKQNKSIDGCLYMISEGGADRAAKLNEFLANTITEIDAGELINCGVITNTTLGEVSSYKLTKDEFSVSLNIATRGKYVVAALTQSGFEQKYLDTLAVSCDSPATELALFNGIDTQGDDVYLGVNMTRYMNTLKMFMNNDTQSEAFESFMNNFDVTNMGWAYYRLGFMGKQIVLDAVMDGNMYNDMMKPVSNELLQAVPADATFVTKFNYDLPQVIDLYKNMFKQMVPAEELARITGEIEKFESESGVALQAGLADNITGEVVSCFTVNQFTGLIGTAGFTVMTVKDSELFVTELGDLINFAMSQAGNEIPARFVQNEVEGKKFYTIDIPQLMPFGIQPSFTTLDAEHVVIALTQTTAGNAFKMYNSGSEDGSILSNSKFQSVMADMPGEKVYFHYTDSEAMLKAVNATANTYWPILSMMASGNGLNLPPMLPQIADKFVGLPSSFAWTTIREDKSIHSHCVSDGLGYASLATVYGGAISVLMPALSRAKVMAADASCMSEMKHVATAALLYANDNDGKLPENLTELGNYLAEESILTPPGYWPITYCGNGLTTASEAQMIIMYTSKVDDDSEYIVGFFDGHIEKLTADAFNDRVSKQNASRLAAGLEEIEIDDDYDNDDNDDEDDEDDYDYEEEDEE